MLEDSPTVLQPSYIIISYLFINYDSDFLDCAVELIEAD
jgi:hypothetical protein